MLMLCLIPAIMSAIAVVREKETGSIANFRSTPITRFEFLIGKQLPYVAVAMINFFSLMLMAIFIFRVPVKGPFLVLLLGTIVYVVLDDRLRRADFVVHPHARSRPCSRPTILSVVPAVNFSGMLAPVSSLSGGAKVLGLTFPSSWYQQISVGVFAKALGMADLWRNIAAIAIIALVFLICRCSCSASRRREMSATPAPPAPQLAEAKPLTFVGHVTNIYRLVIKELRSIRADPIMLILVVYAFSISVNTVATGAVTEATNLSVGIVDEDGSDLSRRIAEGLRRPTFQPPVQIKASDIDPTMDQGKLLFVVEIPPNFESDIRAQRKTGVQINVDATAVAQAGNGANYLKTAIANEIQRFISGGKDSTGAPVNLVVRAAFNPNLKTAWFSAMTQVINQITLLTVILTGAALIREREQGTVEHLLVMPVVPTEIMLAKMIANGLVILVAAMLSLQFVVHWWIGSPINGFLLLFLLGAAIYALVVAALGIMLGTLATTMGQFGLLAMPVLMVTQLLSGSSTPMESMPVWLQYVMQTISPTPHFVAFSQAVLFRGADIALVWRPLVAMLIIGVVYFAVASVRFRKVIFGG